MSAPMSLGILAVLSVGLADAYFLSRLGQEPLAAVGFIYPVTTAVTSLAIGLSAGANAALSQAAGSGEDSEELSRKALHALGLGALTGSAVALLLWLVSGSLFQLLGAETGTAGEIADYMPWWCLSFPMIVMTMIANAAFRARGDAVTATLVMIGSAVVNIALDPILIFGLGPIPEMGTGGAALATMSARALALAAVLWLAWKRGVIGTCGSMSKGLTASLKSVLSVGLPAAFSNAINPAGMAAVTAAVATVGETAVAGFGAATRIQSIALVPLLALSAGISPVVGQNWGAERRDRAGKALWQANAVCLGYGVALGLCLALFAEPLVSLVASGEEDARYGAIYLRWVGWSLAGYGVLVVTNSALNARSKAVWSMGLGVFRTFGLYLPLAWIGALTLGFGGIVGAAAVANVAIVFAALWAASRNKLWPGLTPKGVQAGGGDPAPVR